MSDVFKPAGNPNATFFSQTKPTFVEHRQKTLSYIIIAYFLLILLSSLLLLLSLLLSVILVIIIFIIIIIIIIYYYHYYYSCYCVFCYSCHTPDVRQSQAHKNALEKNLWGELRRIWKTLFVTVAISKANVIFFSFLYHTSFMARMIHFLLCQMVQDNFEDYSSNCAKRGKA